MCKMRLRIMLRCCFTSWRCTDVFSWCSVCEVYQSPDRMTEVQQNEREIEGVSGIRRSSSCCSRFKQRRRKDLPVCVETDGWYLFSDEQHVGVDYVFLTEDVDFSGRHPSEYFKHTSLSQGAVCNLKKQWLQSAVKWKDGAAATQGS